MTDRLLIDTHGDDVRDEVLTLMKYLVSKGVRAPVLLERDNDIPPYGELLDELEHIRRVCYAQGVS